MTTNTTKRAARPRREPGTKKRDSEVLEAAVKVFGRSGYGAATVKDIADELGILKGSVYHYMDGKEDLLYRVLLDTHDHVQAILDEVSAIPGLGPLERLREYVRRQVEYTSRNLDRMSLYYHDFEELSAERAKQVRDKRRVHERFVVGLIAEAQKSGAARLDADPQVVGNFLFGSMIWVYRWYKPRGSLSRTELADLCAEFVLRGVAGTTR